MIQARISDEAKLGWLAGLAVGLWGDRDLLNVQALAELDRYAAAAGLWALHRETSRHFEIGETVAYFDNLLRSSAQPGGSETIARFLKADRARWHAIEEMRAP